MPVEQDMNKAITSLRLSIDLDNLNKLLQSDSFKGYCKMLFSDTSDTQACIMNQYIKDVSSMLALIFAGQEVNFELHLAAERELLPKCFAFTHINYSRSLPFQHVNFSEIKHCNENIQNDLLRKGFVRPLSGQFFSTIHGDLIAEVTVNREVKVRGDLMMDGYSTSDQTNMHLLKQVMSWQNSGRR